MAQYGLYNTALKDIKVMPQESIGYYIWQDQFMYMERQ